MTGRRINTDCILMLGAAALSLAIQSVQAQQGNDDSAQQRSSEARDSRGESIEVAALDQQRPSRTDGLAAAWKKMHGEVVRAEDLLSADISNGYNPVGNVTDLVLTADGRQVQYILFESSYPYTLLGGADGFSSYDRVEINQDWHELTVLLPSEAPPGAPEELQLNRNQARQRLVTRLIGEPMQLANNDVRQIEDILIDRDTGAVAQYVIETNAETLFNLERRTVPADRVTIEQDGDVLASVGVAELDPLQQYPRELL